MPQRGKIAKKVFPTTLEMYINTEILERKKKEKDTNQENGEKKCYPTVNKLLVYISGI